MRTDIRRDLQKWCVAALLPVRLHISRNAGVRLHKTTANQGHRIAKLESKQPTFRKCLRGKFSLDPSSSLHDLTEARKNVVILREIRKTSNPGDVRGHTPERTSRRIWRSFDCSIVSKHACTSTFTKYSFGLIASSLIGDIPVERYGLQASRRAGGDQTIPISLQLCVNLIMSEDR